MDIKKANNYVLRVIFFTSVFVAIIILAEIEVIRSKIKNKVDFPSEKTELQLVLDPDADSPNRGWKTYMMSEPQNDEGFSPKKSNNYIDVTQYYYKLDYPRKWKLIDQGFGLIKIYQEKLITPDESTDTTLITAGMNFGSLPKPTEEETAKDAQITETELKGFRGELRQSLKFKRYYLYLPKEGSGRYFQISLENPNPAASEVFTSVTDSLEIYKKTVKVQKNNSNPISI